MTKAGKKDTASLGVRLACDSLVSRRVASGREAKKKQPQEAALRLTAVSSQLPAAATACLFVTFKLGRGSLSRRGRGWQLGALPHSYQKSVTVELAPLSQWRRTQRERRGRGPQGQTGGQLSTFSPPLRLPQGPPPTEGLSVMAGSGLAEPLQWRWTIR